MSGEKNDLFTSLGSFLKLCLLSSLGSVQPACSYGHQAHRQRAKRGKTHFLDPAPAAAIHAQEESTNLQLLYVALALTIRLWPSLASWLRDVPSHKPYPHATGLGKPLLSLLSRYSPRASAFLGGARARVDKLLTVKRRKKHFSAFATWIGGRECSGSKWGQEPEHVILAPHHVCNSSLGFPGVSKGAISDPLEPWGNADSTSPPGVSAASGTAKWAQASRQGGPKQHFESWHITSKP